MHHDLVTLRIEELDSPERPRCGTCAERVPEAHYVTLGEPIRHSHNVTSRMVRRYCSAACVPDDLQKLVPAAREARFARLQKSFDAADARAAARRLNHGTRIALSVVLPWHPSSIERDHARDAAAARADRERNRRGIR